MIRAAAKNHRDVAVVVDPHDYGASSRRCAATGRGQRRDLLPPRGQDLREHRAIRRRDRQLPRQHRRRRRAAGFSEHDQPAVPPGADDALRREPAPEGGLYVEQNIRESSVATAHQLQGKELSYNNIADTDAALECVKQFDLASDGGPTCVIVKHANPCGVAVGASMLEAYDRAYSTDPESAFGGIIAFNGELDGRPRRRSSSASSSR